MRLELFLTIRSIKHIILSYDKPLNSSIYINCQIYFQVQADKEKLLCEIDEMHAQLEKAQYNTNRFQAEKEDFQLDSERHRSTNEKLQVTVSFLIKGHFNRIQ